MEKRDTGKIRLAGDVWYVYPDNLPFSKIELHPNDVKLINKGFCLSPIRGLTVEFELNFVEKIKHRKLRCLKGQGDYHIYALIVQQ